MGMVSSGIFLLLLFIFFLADFLLFLQNLSPTAENFYKKTL